MKTIPLFFSPRTPAVRRRFRSCAGRFAAAATLGFALQCTMPAVDAAVIAFGTVTDPAGDAFGDKADITSASIAIHDSGHITFNVLFASGSFMPSEDSLSFFIDLDSNTATGSSSLLLPGLGIDAFLMAPLGTPDSGLLSVWNGTSFAGGLVTFAATATTDSYSATLPLSLFGGPTPPIRFAVTSSAPDLEISSVFRDATAIGVVTGTGSGPTPGVPDSGSSALLLSVTTLGLMAGNHLRRRRSSWCVALPVR